MQKTTKIAFHKSPNVVGIFILLLLRINRFFQESFLRICLDSFKNLFQICFKHRLNYTIHLFINKIVITQHEIDVNYRKIHFFNCFDHFFPRDSGIFATDSFFNVKRSMTIHGVH